ncbi:hypothetical protein [Planococcus beijingensis]|uniref:hypothetical protein n=1 Tax=Planococcus beijingensis TaxID=2782551 RepID=UPI00193B1F10|nr:hypothetical protein [Planococcus beijingensis]
MSKYYLNHALIVIFFTAILFNDLLTSGFILTLIAGVFGTALIIINYKKNRGSNRTKYN